MAKTSQVVKTRLPPRKHAGRHRNRCALCGRPRAYIGKFKLCRICFRSMAHRGEIPGVKKASW